MSEVKHERIMQLKITCNEDGHQKIVNWLGFPYYEGDPDEGFGFRISVYEDYPCGTHFSAWIPIEELVSLEIVPMEAGK
jgi:hypothetical protein